MQFVYQTCAFAFWFFKPPWCRRLRGTGTVRDCSSPTSHCSSISMPKSANYNQGRDRLSVSTASSLPILQPWPRRDGWLTLRNHSINIILIIWYISLADTNAFGNDETELTIVLCCGCGMKFHPTLYQYINFIKVVWLCATTCVCLLFMVACVFDPSILL